MRLLFLLLFSTLLIDVNAQVLEKKSHKDKKTGVMSRSVKSTGVGTPNAGRTAYFKSLPFNAFVSVTKTDTGSYYVEFSGMCQDGRYRIDRGDSLKVYLTDSSIHWLRADLDTKTQRTKDVGGSVIGFWYNRYVLDSTNLVLFSEKEISHVQVAPKGKKRTFQFGYVVHPDKGNYVKNSLALLANTPFKN